MVSICSMMCPEALGSIEGGATFRSLMASWYLKV